MNVWHVSFTVSDLARSVAFYRQFGLDMVHEQRQDNAYLRRLVGVRDAVLSVAMLRIPGAPVGPSGHHLELVEYASPRASANGLEIYRPGTAHLAFAVENIAQTDGRLHAAGVEFVSPPNHIEAGVNAGGWTCYFRDPDGITPELVEAAHRHQPATGDGGTVIDAHQHLWSPQRDLYAWLQRAPESLPTEFIPDTLQGEMTASGVSGGVLVQAANTFDDTRAVLAVADQHAWVMGVVGWVPLSEPDVAAAALDLLTGHPRFKGVRHLIHDEPDPDHVLRPAVLRGLAELERCGVPFDVVCVLPRHLQHVATLARRFPNLKLVVDHLAKPPIASGEWTPWADLLRRAGEHDNVFAKVSGLNTAARWATWTAADLQPYIDHALACFGAQRLMFGSDWPVATLAGSSARVVEGTRTVLGACSCAEQQAVFVETARHVYALPESSA